MTKSKSEATSHNVCVGVITSVNGVRGLVKIRSFTETPVDIANFNSIFDETESPYQIKIVSTKNDYVIASVNGISSRNEAERLRNTKLFIKRSDLPELGNDEFYHTDLVGLEVRNSIGVTLGIVKNVVNYGASDILEVSDLNSDKTEYYPFNKQLVPEVNMEQGYLVLANQDELVASPSEEL